MLLRDSLGHINCHTTVIAEVSESLAHLQETLCTIQMASRIRRTQKRTKVLHMHASNILQKMRKPFLRHSGKLSSPNSSPHHALLLQGA